MNKLTITLVFIAFIISFVSPSPLKPIINMENAYIN